MRQEKNINYPGIVDNIIEFCSDKLNDWESNFINNLNEWKGEYTEKQQAMILKINRKYLCRR
jgi:hypothetical protein